MHIFFYQVFLWLYKTSIRLISPWNPKARLWLQGRENIFENVKTALQNNNSQIIWMHSASLGEYEQGLPVAEQLKKIYPSSKLLVTFFSPSGYEPKKNDPFIDYAFYLPFDSKKNAKQFIEIVNPSVVLWIKYDYWFYYLTELKKKNIPALLVSAVFRSNQPFFKWYGKFFRQMLSCFSHLFVQNDASKKMLGSIGVSENVIVSGDTRFDRVIENAMRFKPVDIVEKFCEGENPVIVAGSTWEEDEEELDHYANTHPEIKFIIAPHEMDSDGLKQTKKLFKHSIFYSEILKNDLKNFPEHINVLIIDNIGMLSRLYKYATITYVGGAFGDDGIHNVLEAAVYGKPVVYGPIIEDYVEALELVDCGGGLIIDSALEAEETFNRLLTHPEEYYASAEAAKNYVYSKKGATEIIIRYIQEKRLLTN
ncbi:MAG: 3-deoxy-D-manno-octulosonic acid transferase [Bacteroidetes bacterium]|nr:3-deoxy-D-manno-octulosonic acid transferase [Bacteroidota bacterium]